MFPAFTFIMSAALAVGAATVLVNIDVATILLMLHAASVLYGFFVGFFGDMGEQVLNRRLGQMNVLLQIPQIFPISFKRVMALVFIKDALYYLLYSYVPLTVGIAVAAPLADVSLRSVALLGTTMFTTFMMGMGLSFFLSAIAVRSRRASAISALTLIGTVSLVWPLGVLEPGQLLLPLGFWSERDPMLLLASALTAFLLSSLAVFTVKERYRASQRRYRSRLLPTESRLRFAGDMSALLAKEWMELLRSGALAQVMTGFVGLISGVYFIIWLFEAGVGIPLPFNVVSYSGFVGLMGVMTYSWITSMESNESLNAMPVTVDRVVTAKVALNLVLTAGISVSYVVAIGLARNEAPLIPLGLLVAGCTSVYSVAVTARLTGLWTNTMFFDAGVLTKFSAAVVPPLMAVELASMFMGIVTIPTVYVTVASSLIQILLSILIFKGVKGMWNERTFSYAVIDA
ncbi:MAG: hypothetical protein JSV27_01880 [Candidatus Bathyarchaeota archaeon]|nr:MAG: hypothetical protein JSV27_01880 [Candidatus Bathyarchaeota archaeon]